MKLGFQISHYAVDGLPRRLSQLARRLEGAGFDSLWLMDHLFQIEELGPADQPMLECYTALGFLAGVTSTLRLGAMVSSATFRPPAVLMKAACTLDELSDGRAWLGLGAGWYEREHRGLGIDFPSTLQRFERLEETLQVVRRMLDGDRSPFRGKHYQLEEPICQPRRKLPVLVGGMGERRTLSLVARYADACNLYQGGQVAHKLNVLRQHCQLAGRAYESLVKTTLGVYVPDRRSEFLRELAHMRDLGVDLAVVGVLDPWDEDLIDELISVQRSLQSSD